MKALVTGAASGLGRAMSLELCRQGWSVVALDRDGPGLATLQAEASGIEPVELDLGEARALAAALPAIAGKGCYGLVVLNAGISATGRFEAIPDEVHRRVIAVNAVAPMLIASGLARLNAFTPDAALVFIASLSHFTGYPGAASYAASKDALAVYAKSIARPFARRSIHVLTVFPGPIRTAHAALHAPPGANEAMRMDPHVLACKILASTRSRKNRLAPGLAAKLTAFAGMLAPRTMTAVMRRLIFAKLDNTVW